MDSSKTPYIFYQTWKTKTLPDTFKQNQDKWLKALATSRSSLDGSMIEWQYRLLDDTDLRNLVKDNFPQYISAYDKFSKPIERVDFARYVMMYLGGVYADLDTYPVNKDTTKNSDASVADSMARIQEYVDSNKIILGREPVEHARELYDGRDVVLCNAFMISPPGKRMWIDFMDYIIANYENNYRPVYNTGPMAMTLFMESNKEMFTAENGVEITDPCVFFPMVGDGSFSKRCLGSDGKLTNQTLVVHHWQNTWVTPWWQDKQWLNARYWFWGLMGVFVIVWLREYNKK